MARSVRKRPAAAKASVKRRAKTRALQKKPSKGTPSRATRGPCKPITAMSRGDLLFYRIPTGKNSWRSLRGCKSWRKGYIFEHLGFNRFSDTDKKVPLKAKKTSVPDAEWISKYFFDPSKHRLRADVANLPVNASGKAYRIEDNGGMPFVCYVRDDAVSVFRVPLDGYFADEDWPDEFEKQRLFYTAEVFTLSNPTKAWVGIDTCTYTKQDGNTILVHTRRENKTIFSTLHPGDDDIKVVCTDLSGEEVFSVTLKIDDDVSALLFKVANHMRCDDVRCFGPDGETIEKSTPLKSLSQLNFQDGTQTYVYIGDEIYSFESSEVVTSYYSLMGNNSVPYPVALTPNFALFMLDREQVSRREIQPFVPSLPDGEVDWSNAYTAFYQQNDLKKVAFSNVKQLCERLL